jgi:hypothetical protein
LKPGYHFIGSRVETRRLSSYGSGGVNGCTAPASQLSFTHGIIPASGSTPTLVAGFEILGIAAFIFPSLEEFSAEMGAF